jgi:hypothetical protein
VKRGRLIFLLVALLAISFLVLLRSRSREARKRTAVGEFELLQVTVAGQVFREGSWFERLFEKLIPPSGLQLAQLQLRRPIRYPDPKEAPIMVWLLYRGTNFLRPVGPHLVQSQVIVKDSSGKQFSNPLPFVRRSTWTANPAAKFSAANEMLISLPIASFPTDQDHFSLSFSLAPITGTEQDWVEFKITNPLPPRPRISISHLSPQTNLVDGQTIILRAIGLQPARFEFQLPAPNWSVDNCTLQDGKGNEFIPSAEKSHDSTSPPEAIYQCHFNQWPEADQNWRINLTLVHRSDLPLEGRRVVHLSSHGGAQTVTNQAGQVFTCRFDGYTLSITGAVETALSRLGWRVIGATNEISGEPLPIGRFAPSLPTPPMSQTWRPLQTACSNVVLHLAYPRRLATQFHLNSTDGRTNQSNSTR